MARRTLGPDRPFPDMACFHARQCAEKYQKGYLVAHGAPFRSVRDLGYLSVGVATPTCPGLTRQSDM